MRGLSGRRIRDGKLGQGVAVAHGRTQAHAGQDTDRGEAQSSNRGTGRRVLVRRVPEYRTVSSWAPSAPAFALRRMPALFTTPASGPVPGAGYPVIAWDHTQKNRPVKREPARYEKTDGRRIDRAFPRGSEKRV